MKNLKKYSGATNLADRQTDIYFIDRKKVITDLFVIELREIYVHVYTKLLIFKNRMTIYMVKHT